MTTGTLPARPAPDVGMQSPPERESRPAWRAELRLALATVAVTLLAMVPVFQLWNARLEVPFTFRGDANAYTMMVQNVIDTGWYQHTDRLGAPFGLDLHDFPQGADNLHFALVKMLTLFSSEPGTVLNLYFLLTFPLVALSALLVLRRLGVSRPGSLVFAVAFAFLPYHFHRGVHHLFLSGYFAVPLGAYLALSVLDGTSLFLRRRRGAGLLAFASPRTAGTLAMCAVIGSADAYYAAFTVLLVASAAVLNYTKQRSLADVAPALLATIAIVGVLGLNLAPSVMYQRAHGANAVAQRHPGDSERFGLKLGALLIPPADHRVAPLAAMGEHYQTNTLVPSEGGQSLGLLSSAGLLWLLGVSFLAVTGSSKLAAVAGMHRKLAFLTLVALLTGMVGGLSVLINFFVTPQFRSWNRISLFIAFFSLAAMALVVDEARRRARHPLRCRFALAALLLLALLDQTTARSVPAYAVNAAEFDSDRAFVRAIEAQLPDGAMVYQLPYHPFPESEPAAKMRDYDHFRGYLHSERLRWSYGGIRGRESDWQEALTGQPVDLVATRLAAVGYAGVYIDRYGYLDGGRSLEAEFIRILGRQPVVSANARLSFFPLVDHATSLQRLGSESLAALKAQSLRPVRITLGAGFDADRAGADSFSYAGTDEATITVVNPDRTPRTVVLDATLEIGSPGQVHIGYPDGVSDTISATTGGTRLHRVLVVPPGSSVFDFSAQGALLAVSSSRETHFRLLNPALYDQPPAGTTAGASG